MAESSRRYNLRDTRKKPQGVLLKRWEMEYSKLISNENRRIPLETVKTAIRSAFEDGMFEKWRITLKCPLSGQRIKLPARYADCTHIECFDLEAFLRMKSQKNLQVCPICQKEVKKSLANLRIDEYIETVLSSMPDTMQVELLSDGSFTNVHEEFVTAANVIDDEEPYAHDKNTPSSEIKQEALDDDDEYIMLSEAESIVKIVEMKPISLMPLNMDIKPKIASSSELEQIHSGEDQKIQSEHNSIEPAIRTPVQNSSNDSVVKLNQRKRGLPLNDFNNQMPTTSKRSNENAKSPNSAKKPYQCDHCSFSSASKSNLVIHTRIHTGDKPFKCEQCSYASAQKVNLNNHVRIHTGEKPYKCDQCSYASAEKVNLNNHVRIHTGEKPYKCEQCTYSCAQKSTLDGHVRTHSGEKLFKCNHCSFASVSKGLLVIHTRTHTGEKPYKCNHCSYTSAQITTLNNHVLSHTGEKPFKCGHCSYACAQKGNLDNHVRTHTGDKPFKCNQCTSTFAQKSSLNGHVRSHSNEKPFKCNQCSFASTSSNNLIIHMRTHSGEKPYKCSFAGHSGSALYNHIHGRHSK